MVILLFLDKYHDMPMSMSTLKRRLCEYNLKRNEVDINLPAVEKLIRDEMDMLRIKYGLFVPRQEVESLIRTIDPAGVEERKRHRLKRRKYESPGPTYC